MNIAIYVLLIDISIVFIGVGCFIAYTNPLLGGLTMTPGLLILTIATIVFMKKQNKDAKYKCPECGYIYNPEFKNYALSARKGEMSKLTCPRCKVKAYHEPVKSKR